MKLLEKYANVVVISLLLVLGILFVSRDNEWHPAGIALLCLLSVAVGFTSVQIWRTILNWLARKGRR